MKTETRKTIDFRNLALLTAKVANELHNPEQLFDPKRRTMLFKNALIMIAGSFIDPEETTRAIEAEIEGKILKSTTSAGIPFYLMLTKEYSFVVHVLPRHVDCEYLPAQAESYQRSAQDNDVKIVGLLAGTTYSTPSSVLALSDMRLPSEGYMDHRGVLKPFIDREPKDAMQHGGILVTSNYKTVEMLSYLQMVDLLKAKYSKGEALMQANWYMDSNNQNEVCARRNLQSKNVFNCLGELLNQDGSRTLFTFSSYEDAVEMAYTETENAYRCFPNDTQSSTMRTVAAACNYISKQHNALGWRVCGLEYNNGGMKTMHIRLDFLPKRDFFIFTSTQRN